MEFIKEDVARLADVDHNLVRIEMNACYQAMPSSAKNAIEQVRALGDHSFQEALEFLQNISESHDLTLQHLQPANVPPTDLEYDSEKKCKSEIIRQLGAVDAKYYRLTALDLDGRTINLGKEKGSDVERVFTQKDISAKIPQLRLLNNKENKNIIVTPLDTTAYYMFLDDAVDEINRASLRQAGYRPCLIQKSSPKSKQVLFKIPKTTVEFSPDYIPNEKTPARFRAAREDINAYFVALNRQFGDEKIQGLRHGFRLAGFRNLKEKYRFEGDKFPFVEILHTENVFCEKTSRLARNKLCESKIVDGGQAADELVPVYTSKQRKLVRNGGEVAVAADDIRSGIAGRSSEIACQISREEREKKEMKTLGRVRRQPRKLSPSQIDSLINTANTASRARAIAGSVSVITEPTMGGMKIKL